MKAVPPAFSSEIAMIQAVYERLENDESTRQLWLPLNETEAAYRVRQAQVFRELLAGEAGWQSLEGVEILDVGCGLGRHLRQFIDLGAQPGGLHGIDLREPLLARARELSPNIDFKLTNGCEIPFADEYFGLVTQHVVFSSIGSLGIREELAREMVRVLKPGGYIYWWDMLGMAHDAGGAGQALDPRPLLPGMPAKIVMAGLRMRPSESFRPLRGITNFLRPWIDRFGYWPTHMGALFGPKPNG
jgi:SAM-dependent methyltransferase